MKKATITLLTLIPAVALLSGCATRGKVSTPVVGAVADATIDGEFKPTVVVTTFADETRSKAGTDDPRVHQFEGIYLAGRLVQALNQAGLQAWFAPACTPAADYYVRGAIIESDGETLALKLSFEQCGGTELWHANYKTRLKSKDFFAGKEPVLAVFDRPIKRIQNSLANLSPNARGQIAMARVSAYSGLPKEQCQLNGRAITVAETAADVEREKLLMPFTTMVKNQSDSLQESYQAWEQDACNVAAQKRAERGSAWAAGIMAFMSAAAAGVAQGTGDYTGAAELQGQAMQLADLSAQASQRASALGDSMERLRTAFGESVQPVTITFLDKVYTLNGDLGSQLDKFREIVRDHMEN